MYIAEAVHQGSQRSPPAFRNKRYLYTRTIRNKGEYMKTVLEPTYSFVILTLILIVIDTFLALISVRLIPAAAGSPVSPLFIAVAFMILFTLWFGRSEER